ncbi:hypothetical protein A0H81_08214 [Grifola frondosa]|uniref:Uncharacterized protein n=1 Tax=Grifola frondosa TaxID=5627 RepID=A0A1C7M619_GRIFR|nr:hypothetical protein A0H81_08214 [Grifola frondosa]
MSSCIHDIIKRGYCDPERRQVYYLCGVVFSAEAPNLFSGSIRRTLKLRIPTASGEDPLPCVKRWLSGYLAFAPVSWDAFYGASFKRESRSQRRLISCLLATIALLEVEEASFSEFWLVFLTTVHGWRA